MRLGWQRAPKTFIRSYDVATRWPRMSNTPNIGAAVQITLIPDNSIASAPAALTAAVEAAASVFEQDFPGNYNVNISYGWGTFDNTPSDTLTDTFDGVFSLGGGPAFEVSYSQLSGWLIANAASSAQLTAIASLPASNASFPDDANNFSISSAEEKALGVFSGDSGAIDGSIGFNIGDIDQSEFWEAGALTEIIHALGWDTIAQGQESVPSVADLFRYSSPGQYQWTSGQPAYFSIDGGNTNLGDFSTSFDQTLFTDLPDGDALKLPLTTPETSLTSFDIEALGVIGFGVADVAPPPTPSRFNAGGNSPNILWQDTSGQAAIWDLNGANVLSAGTVGPNPGSSWQEIGGGDFNGDGHSDILFQNTSGQAAIWEMNGSNIVSAGTVGPNPGPDWRAVGTGDFNDDGHSDILFQNTSGQAAIWEMNGSNIVSAGTVGPNPGPSWQEIGTGDFNGDGHSDILFQKTNGQVAIWEMNGSNIVSAVTVDLNPGPDWKAVGTGDFNDDGHSDILFQSTNGQAAIWEMNGTNILSAGTVGLDPGPSWKAVGTGDFNGDGHSDILWQNTSGQAAVWEMNGTSILTAGTVGPNPGPTWLAV
jgi:FG-GAP-like repeat